MDRSQVYQHCRNFLLTATREECEREFEISVEHGDQVRADSIRELIKEWFE